MKVIRSTLVAAVAVVAAACGDKVNIIQPTTGAGGVNSVVVSPATATMSVGQTVNFTAAVNADAGIATTVTWSSGDATKVSVSATGVATAVAATPGVAICATSTVDTSKKGCASVTVGGTGPGNTVAPSIAISAVNFTNAFGQQQPAPVPPAGVGGQLNIVMSVNPGTAQLDSIVLKIDGKNAYKQAFSGAQAAAILSAAADADQQASSFTVTASVNTADYNTTTGVATWQNGNRSFQAFVYGKQGVSAGGSPTNVQGNSPAATYRFANPDGFHMTVTFTVAGAGVRTAGEAQLASAVDALGYGWKSGAMNISALFVQFTPGTQPANATATFNNLGCSAGGVRALALTNSQTVSDRRSVDRNVLQHGDRGRHQRHGVRVEPRGWPGDLRSWRRRVQLGR